MSDVAVRVDNLGKRYVLGHQKNGDFRETFSQTVRDFVGQKAERREEFWALRELNFEIKRGEVIGIIGRNGAGKSTLLKILSRIIYPTVGRFEIDGRVSSLLEVGTGFHSELTGRENVFLNGTILGMRRAEIKRKFDEIVAFSGVERFLDTAVKHYSSGMRVRLAFSVAAHLEPEILIVDEVLAVGDAEFQKKCFGKMNEVSRDEGRTILFVSHNLAAVSQLCTRGLLLNAGRLLLEGRVGEVIDKYLSQGRRQDDSGSMLNLDLREGNGLFRVKSVGLLNAELEPVSIAVTGAPVLLHIKLDRAVKGSNGAFRIDIAIDNEWDLRVGWFSSDAVTCNVNRDFEEVFFKLSKLHLGGGTYYVTFYITWNGEVVDYVHQAFAFTVEEGDFFGTGKVIPRSQTFLYAAYEILLN